MKNQVTTGRVDELPGMIAVKSVYSERNNSFFRTIEGKWYPHLYVWAFPDSMTARSILADLFGEKSEDVEVLVPYEVIDLRHGPIVQVGGYVLASRRGRDDRVMVPDGVYLEEGKFASSGGSRANPSVGLDSGMVFRLVCRQSFASRYNLSPAPARAAVEV